MPAKRKPLSDVDPAVKQIADARIEERIKVYEQDFDLSSLTTVDRTQIRNMAALEIACENIGDQLAAGGLATNDVKYLSDAMKLFMAEHRMQAVALGIDRKTRLSDEESELEMYFPRVAREARDFLYQRALSIVCLECRRGTAQVDIRTGMLLYHLYEEDATWSCQFTCPKCGNPVTLNHDNYQDYLMKKIDGMSTYNEIHHSHKE